MKSWHLHPDIWVISAAGGHLLVRGSGGASKGSTWQRSLPLHSPCGLPTYLPSHILSMVEIYVLPCRTHLSHKFILNIEAKLDFVFIASLTSYSKCGFCTHFLFGKRSSLLKINICSVFLCEDFNYLTPERFSKLYSLVHTSIAWEDKCLVYYSLPHLACERLSSSEEFFALKLTYS